MLVGTFGVFKGSAGAPDVKIRTNKKLPLIGLIPTAAWSRGPRDGCVRLAGPVSYPIFRV